jgi:hypothetical protein
MQEKRPFGCLVILILCIQICHPSHLTLCSKWTTQQLPHHNSSLHALRDLVQTIQHAKSRFADLESLVNFRRHEEPKLRNSSDPQAKGVLAAFYSPLSNKELDEKIHVEMSRLSNATRSMEVEVRSLIAAGLLLQEASQAQPQDLAPCLLHKLNPNLYPDRPIVTFMLQYYKRPWMIQQIVDRIRSCNEILPVELVVNVDEPSSASDWAGLAANSSGLVVPVFSNNVHEIRAYNRLVSLARGRYVITHQDDELMPSSCAWLKDVVTWMDNHPHTGAMGLKGFIFADLDCCDNGGMAFKDDTTEFKVQFVSNVDFSPMMIRKRAWDDVGGLDEGLSEKGECGIISDYELSLRLWARGWLVAFHRLDNRDRDSSGAASGTHTPENGERCWGRQQRLAAYTYKSRWGNEFLKEVFHKVRLANHRFLKPIFVKCPFDIKYEGCDLWEKDNYAPAFKPRTDPGQAGV